MLGSNGQTALVIADLRATIETQALIIKGLRQTVRDMQIQIGDRDRRLTAMKATLARSQSRGGEKAKKK